MQHGVLAGGTGHDNWHTLGAAGIGFLPSNDISLYDQAGSNPFSPATATCTAQASHYLQVSGQSHVDI